MKTFSADRLLDMRSRVESIVWPPIVTGPAATLATLVLQMNQSQWSPAEMVIDRQYRQLAGLARYAYEQSPHFRQRMDAAGLTPEDIGTPEGLRRLPLLTRRDIQQAGETLHSKVVPPAHMPYVDAKTSGSTGEPITIRKSAINHILWQANMMREHQWHKRDFTQRLINIRAQTDKITPYPNWGNPVDQLFVNSSILSVPIVLSMAEQLRIINEFKPGHLIIYPSTLRGLVEYGERENISVNCLEHIWCIGETLDPDLRARASAFFGASVEDDYSSNEIGIMALQCPDSDPQNVVYHVMAESIIMEVLDDQGNPCAPGEVGKIVITNLHNFATPVVRYEIGDYAEMSAPCACGRGLPTIKRIRGRKRNLALKPDGTHHWPPITTAVFRCGVPVRQFQVVQHSVDDIEMRLYMDKPPTPEQEARLTEFLHKAFDHPFPIRFTYYDDGIPLPKNGKFEDFICRI